MNNLIENIFRLTKNAPSAENFPDDLKQKYGMITPKIPLKPYGCPSVEDLKYHLFIMEDDSIEHHIQSCWLCKKISNQYQKRTLLFEIEKLQILLTYFFDMFKGNRGWSQKVVAQSYAFLLIVIVLLSVFLLNPHQDKNIKYCAAGIMNDSLQSLNRFMKTTDFQQLTDIARQIKLFQFKVEDHTIALPVITNDSKMDSIDLKINDYSNISKKDMLNIIDLWRKIFLFYCDALLQAGNIESIDTAIHFLSIARTYHPNDTKIIFGLGELYKMSAYSFTGEEFIKRHHQAIELYEYMIQHKMAEKDPRPYHYAGWSYYELNQIIKAESYFKSAVAIDNKYAKAHFNLAMLYKEHPNIYGSQSLDLYEKAFQCAQESIQYFMKIEGIRNPRIPYTLAIFSAIENKWENCLSWLEESLKSDPWYCFRARYEKWFAPLINQNHPYNDQFQKILDDYHPKRPKSFINMGQDEYLSNVMYE